jgi:hypothetical protein
LHLCFSLSNFSLLVNTVTGIPAHFGPGASK